MTVPIVRRYSRKSLVCASVSFLVAVALLLAYLLGAFNHKARGNIEADDVCSNVNDKQAVAETLNSALPEESRYDFSTTSHPDRDYTYRSSCSVNGDHGHGLLLLTADMGYERPWHKWADQEVPPTFGAKTSYFDAGIKGVSTPNMAVIDVPCYAHERENNSPHNLTVIANALKPLEGSSKETRQKIIDLALDFARSAHKQAKCDRPSELPTEVTAPND